MASLEQATDRLQKALKQLEAAVEGRCSTDEEMKADLEEFKGENKRLQSTLESVSGRLDNTISRIKQMMEA